MLGIMEFIIPHAPCVGFVGNEYVGEGGSKPQCPNLC